MLLESELILNENGSIYHLALHPEQIAPTVLLVGAPERVGVISQHFDFVSEKVQHRELVTHTGEYRGKPISVVSTGMGAGGVEIVINELDALANIDFKTREINNKFKQLTLIRLGTCGTLHDDIPLESLAMTSYGLGMDSVLHYYDYQYSDEEKNLLQQLDGQMGSLCGVRPYVAAAHPQLLSAFDSWTDCVGITCTSVGFYGPQGRQLRGKIGDAQLVEKLRSFEYQGDRIVNFEMEAAVILGLGGLLGHRSASISTVIAQRASGNFCKQPARAVNRLIESALEGVYALGGNK